MNSFESATSLGSFWNLLGQNTLNFKPNPSLYPSEQEKNNLKNLMQEEEEDELKFLNLNCLSKQNSQKGDSLSPPRRDFQDSLQKQSLYEGFCRFPFFSPAQSISMSRGRTCLDPMLSLTNNLNYRKSTSPISQQSQMRYSNQFDNEFTSIVKSEHYSPDRKGKMQTLNSLGSFRKRSRQAEIEEVKSNFDKKTKKFDLRKGFKKEKNHFDFSDLQKFMRYDEPDLYHVRANYDNFIKFKNKLQTYGAWNLGKILTFIKENTLSCWKEEELESLYFQLFDQFLQLAHINFRHTDIKPKNVIFGMDGKFGLLDFGEYGPK